MTLTLGNAPLGSAPTLDANYTIHGPRHRLLMTPFPRRVRAEFGGRTVFDTRAGMLLHESNLLPVLYVPVDDIDRTLLSPTDHTTHCPFKGDAAYHSIVVGDRVAENAVWSYPAPMEGADWLAGTMAFYWDRLDAWYDEDEQVHAHLRDPYHRVDTRQSSAHVRVTIGGVVVAETDRPVVLSETGLPNRWYLPPDDVELAHFAASETTSHCPYKGEASYHHARVGDTEVPDAAFLYHTPFRDAVDAAGHWCFVPDDRITVEVDGVDLDG